MTDDKPPCRDLLNPSRVAHRVDAISKRQVIRPTVTVTPAGIAMAGGCPLGRVERGPDGGPVLVVEDRCRPRCLARGSTSVQVSLEELVAAARRVLGNGTKPAQDEPKT